ncbi:MAG: hypothetical protein CVV24_14950 [Ignavibacteriae bacterium HGW-Ignavibacteriae-3]|nr:MAG: hypothetical protein CVV24_14950 [Ignavibacteriae bacterium HGW-Ignavibacteriae-3]
MKRTTLFWIIAIVITLLSAFYQRVTGPSYPFSGKTVLDGKEISYRLDRSHESTFDCKIRITTDDPQVIGVLYWKKFNTNDEYTAVQMNGSRVLYADLPAQKRLEKLEYYITLTKRGTTVTIPNEKSITIRFKDHVPIWILIPHIFAMFFAMTLSTRTGLEFFNKEPKIEKLTLWTIIVLFIGGFPLGFAMNELAFGEMWGGWPFGNDVTDNKTQVAFIVWLIAFYLIKKNKKPALWVLIAALVLIAVYTIPHSV